ncbi:MAG: DinB family protein [Ferruginibacter sp.]
METKPVSNRMYSLLVLYDMHTKFLPKVTEGFSEKDAQNRLDTKANHVAWLAGSLVQQRFELAKSFGVDATSAANELFKDHKGIQDDVNYPPLSGFIKDWGIISPRLREALMNLSDEKLDSMFTMPEMSMSYFEFISFCIYREANCIGQIALWRRLLSYPAMNYM